jgi:predicted dehydrogenase
MTGPTLPSDAGAASARPLNWGVLGAARIARKVVPAMRQAGTVVAAVGAGTRARAEAFARELSIPRAIEGYQEVIDCPEVDAVYIALTNDQHCRWALACARAGKPCLCEKPMALSVEEARQLREAFSEAGARLVEAFMWRHHPQTPWILHQLREGEIGDLLRIHAEFSFNLDRPDDYRWRDEHGGGSLWDIGVYCVNAMRLFFGEEPHAASVCLTPAPGARQADATAVGWLDFGHGRVGTFQSSFVSDWRQMLTLTGTHGIIEVERPFIGVLDQPTRCRRVTAKDAHEETFPPDNAYARMVDHFRRAVHDASFALMPAEDGVAQAVVMASLAASGLHGGMPQILDGY